MRVRPTHYTIGSLRLKSWVVEGSLDGEAWTEIDQKTNNEDFRDWATASFAVSNSAECRSIRLAQTGKNHWTGHSVYMPTFDELCISDFEFFETLLK
jgi:hypothetical protein